MSESLHVACHAEGGNVFGITKDGVYLLGTVDEEEDVD